MAANPVVFATYLESAEDLRNVSRLSESLRTFGGRFSSAPLRVYARQDVEIANESDLQELKSQGIEISTSHAPEGCMWLYYANKAYAAADAETAAEDDADLLIWIDDDSVVLSEPVDFELAEGTDLAYVPVMHNRSGSLYDNPPDAFWSRIYEKLAVTDEMLFPMVTPADNRKIRAYFHAGLMVVRPKKGVLRRWPKEFERLYNDAVLAEMCRVDATKRVFLHQTALVGAVLHTTPADAMVELSGRYNYPIFFEKQYGADQPFDSIADAITIRCLISPENMGRNWDKELSGPPEKIAWLKDRLNPRQY